MNSYSSLDIAISICRYSELYELSNYKNVIDRIELEIDKVLKPCRQRVLRGYQLMASVNSILDSKSDRMLLESNNNSVATSHMQRFHDDILKVVYEVKNIIENSYKTSININKETDSQLLSRFKDDAKVEDLVFIRNVLNKSAESTIVPINLTQKNMDEIGYNNHRIDKNMKSVKNSAQKLSESIILKDKHMFVKDVIYTAISIQSRFEIEGEKDYIKTHTNNEVKEWLYGRIT